eukprot:338819-Chlamydomonas_euryale.AAC.3
MQAVAPTSTLPPIPLSKPYVLPAASHAADAPLNTTARLFRRAADGKHGGHGGAARQRQFVYSRFRQVWAPAGVWTAEEWEGGEEDVLDGGAAPVRLLATGVHRKVWGRAVGIFPPIQESVDERALDMFPPIQQSGEGGGHLASFLQSRKVWGEEQLASFFQSRKVWGKGRWHPSSNPLLCVSRPTMRESRPRHATKPTASAPACAHKHSPAAHPPSLCHT